jgi:soluble lytic murein transglycosylase
VVSRHSAEGALARLESNWHAGWIALRHLDNPNLAITHFERLGDDATRPISIARGEYWLGRAAAAAGDDGRAAKHFAAAAAHPTTYYGQLALARMAPTAMAPARKPVHADAARRIVQEREPVRALRLLAQAGYERLVPGLLMALAEASDDALLLVGLAEIAHAMGHPGATVHIGKLGTYAAAPTEVYAFPELGIPSFNPVGPPAEKALVYAIARQESLFNASAASPAGALGLMQLMPATARETAGTYGLAYSRDRLTADPAYNAALGSAHLGELIREFGDAYALVFAAYNAGRSRVYQWLKRFGDPRRGEVDPVDWVEMIPFTETRNYVQRVMEGLQVYRATLKGNVPLLIARDMRLPDTHIGGLQIAGEGSDPFAAVSEADSSEPVPTRGLGFAPRSGFSFGSSGGSFGFGGAGGGSFGFGGN